MTTPEPPTLQSQIEELVKEWREPRPPSNQGTPKWLRKLAEDLKESKNMPELIQTVFREKNVGRPTQVVYLSKLKSLLIENGVLLNPKFPAFCEREHPDLWRIISNMKTNYGRWRFLRSLPLLKERYLKREMLVNGDLIDDKLKNDVKMAQETRLVTRKSLVVDDPAAFQQYMLDGLGMEDPARLFQSLLFVSGRRCAVFCVPLSEVWSVEGLDMLENKIRYKEYMKKRGKCKQAEIPLLCSANHFLSALDYFQTHCCVPAEDGMAKHSGTFRTWCRSNPFFSSDNYLRPCDFRALYSAYIAREAEKEAKFVPGEICKALLHVRLGTALSYMHVVLKEKDSETSPSKRKPESDKL